MRLMIVPNLNKASSPHPFLLANAETGALLEGVKSFSVFFPAEGEIEIDITIGVSNPSDIQALSGYPVESNAPEEILLERVGGGSKEAKPQNIGEELRRVADEAGYVDSTTRRRAKQTRE